MQKLKVLSLFSGIGAFEKGLERLNINHELIGFSEIDKYAITSYCAIHNTDEKLNLGDISKVKDLSKFSRNVDLIVGGSPCQDFSIAGKQQGSIFECLDCGEEFNPLTIHHTKRNNCPKCNSTNLEKTRSSLLIEYLRTIREIKPKYFIYENVKNIVGKKFKSAFDMFEQELKEYGYNTYYQVLNAKNYGIPQNRERVFVVGIRKDTDSGKFEFPNTFDNGLRLRDFLENEVEEKYYINDARVNELLNKFKDGLQGHYPSIEDQPLSSSALSSREHRASGWSENIGTLCARDYKDPKVIAEPIPNEIIQLNSPNHFSQRVYSKEGISPTISAGNNGGGKEPCKIVCEQRTDEGLRFFKGDVCGTIRTIDSGGDKRVIEQVQVPKPDLIGGIGEINYGKQYRQGNRVYDSEKTAMCLLSQPVGNTGGNSYLYAVKEETKGANKLEYINNAIETIIEKNDGICPEAWDLYNKNPINSGIAKTLSTDCGHNGTAGATAITHNYKIRKLTPKECWRLMGFDDEDYEKAKQQLNDGCYKGKDRSNSQLYKQAGNSIVVNVLEEIFKNLFKEYIS